ncbi:hypothetical protein MAR_006059, partial [Mya arenaria]
MCGNGDVTQLTKPAMHIDHRATHSSSASHMDPQVVAPGRLSCYCRQQQNRIQCWHCIADDCSKDPSGNYKATKKACNFGQACQKVYFETLEVTEKTYISHTSTVRGCSSECKSRDDFKNCTMLQRTLSGCVRKDCCSDTDLCNSAEIVGMGIQCWHCIADDCSKDPSGNYKATKKACNFGQACQKVYFETLEVTETTYISHTSTVRGCSRECKSRDDFNNCTMLQQTLSGCVRKDCCSDTDLCNSATIVGMGVP